MSESFAMPDQPGPEVLHDPKLAPGYDLAVAEEQCFDAGWGTDSAPRPDDLVSESIKKLGVVVNDMLQSLDWIVNATQEMLFPVAKFVGTKLSKTIKQAEGIAGGIVDTVRGTLGETLIRTTNEVNLLRESLNAARKNPAGQASRMEEPYNEEVKEERSTEANVSREVDSGISRSIPEVSYGTEFDKPEASQGTTSSLQARLEAEQCVCVSLSDETISAIRTAIQPRSVVGPGGEILIGAACGATGADAWSRSDCSNDEIKAYWADNLGDARGLERHLIEVRIMRNFMGVK